MKNGVITITTIKKLTFDLFTPQQYYCCYCPSCLWCKTCISLLKMASQKQQQALVWTQQQQINANGYFIYTTTVLLLLMFFFLFLVEKMHLLMKNGVTTITTGFSLHTTVLLLSFLCLVSSTQCNFTVIYICLHISIWVITTCSLYIKIP